MSIEERVERLEKQNKRLKLALGLLAVLLAVGVTMVTTRQEAIFGETVKAQQFLLTDKGGKTRASLDVTIDGEPYLNLYDKAGKRRFAVGVLKSGEPSLGFLDKNGKRRVAIGIRTAGEPILRLSDKEGKSRVAISIRKSGDASLQFLDTKKRVRVQMGTIAGRGGFITLVDALGKPKWGKSE